MCGVLCAWGVWVSPGAAPTCSLPLSGSPTRHRPSRPPPPAWAQPRARRPITAGEGERPTVQKRERRRPGTPRGTHGLPEALAPPEVGAWGASLPVASGGPGGGERPGTRGGRRASRTHGVGSRAASVARWAGPVPTGADPAAATPGRSRSLPDPEPWG